MKEEYTPLPVDLLPSFLYSPLPCGVHEAKRRLHQFTQAAVAALHVLRRISASLMYTHPPSTSSLCVHTCSPVFVCARRMHSSALGGGVSMLYSKVEDSPTPEAGKIC